MFICIGHNLPPCRSVYAEARVPNFRFGAAIVIEKCAIGRIFQSFLLCGCQKRLYGSFLLFPILPFMPRPVHLIKKNSQVCGIDTFRRWGGGAGPLFWLRMKSFPSWMVWLAAGTFSWPVVYPGGGCPFLCVARLKNQLFPAFGKRSLPSGG